MELVKHETCQQYVARRLSEGWQSVWQSGHHLILSSPDGNILRVVDLRNDVETLRPNAAGDECNITFENGAACPNHFQNVDEVIADDYTTGVKTDVANWERDLYNIENHSVGSGTINSVRVYTRTIGASSPTQSCLKIVLKSGITVDEGSDLTLINVWSDDSETWMTNPATGSPFTWAEIDSVQVGAALRQPRGGQIAFCTQVYVEVDYTPPVELESKSANMGSKMVGAGLI